MRRGRHKQGQAPISLFAFQDVMMAVIGVMLLMTLLLALQLTLVRSVAASSEPAEVQAAELRERLDRLQRREKELREALERASRLASEAEQRGRSGLLSQALFRRSELQALYDKIEDVEAESSRLFERVEGRLAEGSEVRESLAQRRSLEREVARKQAELEELRRNPRLTYIAHQAFAKSPILAVVRGDRIRVGASTEAAAALTFAEKDASLRARQLLAYLDSFSPARRYVLLINTPEGLTQAQRLIERIGEKGFDIGRDLLPSDWTALLRAAEGGEAP